jgi:hypothetical protein
MDVNLITKEDFKAHFFRDFKYGDISEGCDVISDADLDKSFVEAKMNFNPGLWGTQETLKIALLYCVAHYLVCDIQMSKEGVDSSSTFSVNSRNIGSVSESYTVPDWILKSPYMSYFASTRYGLKYCSLLRPRIIGNVAVYSGLTTQ